MKRLILCCTLLFSLSACGLESNTMPETMPDDFDFFIRYGFQAKNEINTYDGTFTKDLIKDGTMTVDMILTDEELQWIYSKMRSINIAATKNLEPKSTDCYLEPASSYILDITMNGENVSLIFNTRHCDLTRDMKQLITLVNDIHSQIIAEKDEYKQLPEPRGGYE